MSAPLSIDRLLNRHEQEPPFVRVVVATTEGSAPRETGAVMIVDRSGSAGTIGGGQLEFDVIARARAMLSEPEGDPAMWLRELIAYPLGPKLGQCCGGMVRVLIERFTRHEIDALHSLKSCTSDSSRTGDSLFVRRTAPGHPVAWCHARQEARAYPLPVANLISGMLSGERAADAVLVGQPGSDRAYFLEPASQPKTPLFIFGAGHVGRAIVKIAADLPFEIHWIDTHDDRFPQALPANVVRIVARDPAIIAASAPANAFHLVLTYSHALDFAICHSLLSRASFAFLGLIGSSTKRARFMKRLRESGIAPETLSRLNCPIGLSALKGKAPSTIAVSVNAQLIEQLERGARADIQEIGGACEPSENLSA